MNSQALYRTLLAVMGWILVLGGVVISSGVSEATSLRASNTFQQPELERKNIILAHLDENDSERDRKYKKGHRRYKKCHRKNHFRFCGPKSLKIKTIQELKFGRVVGDSEHGGAVVIHADTGSKSVRRLYDGGGFHSRAEFEIMGKPDKRFVITLPPKITLPIGISAKPRLESFTIFPSSMGTFGPDGTARVFIGATLKVGPVQQGGEGSGPVPIFVDYVR